MLGTYLVVLVTVIYFFAAVGYVLQSQYGSALIFFAYAIANIGVVSIQKGLMQ